MAIVWGLTTLKDTSIVTSTNASHPKGCFSNYEGAVAYTLKVDLVGSGAFVLSMFRVQTAASAVACSTTYRCICDAGTRPSFHAHTTHTRATYVQASIFPSRPQLRTALPRDT